MATNYNGGLILNYVISIIEVDYRYFPNKFVFKIEIRKRMLHYYYFALSLTLYNETFCVYYRDTSRVTILVCN